MARTTVCTNCGSKLALARERCPRCRARVVQPDPAAAAAGSRRMARMAGALFGTFALGVGLLWMMQGPEHTVSARPADPLAARPTASSPAEPLVPTAAAPAEAAGGERPFLDPAGAGAVSYSAGNYAGALARFEEAVASNPGDAESLSNLGQMLVRLQRAGEAIPHFERACALNPDRWAYRFNLARALGLLNRWDESIAAYRQAQQLFPDDYVTTFNLARALHNNGNELAAVDEYKKAIALDPSDASFRMALGISYERLQNAQEAAAAYGEYLRLSPEAADAEKVRTKIAQLTGQSGAGS